MNMYRSPDLRTVYLRLVKPPKSTGGEYLESEDVQNGSILKWSVNKLKKFELIAHR